MLVRVSVDNISEAELSTPKSLRERSLRVQCSEHDHNAVLGRAHDMPDLLWRVPQWQSGKKNHEFFMAFRGNIVTGITGNTFSDRGMLFETFLMKNIFIDFPTPILKHIFCHIQLKISCFLEANLIVICEHIMIVQIIPMKIIEIFDEIMQKLWFKIGVGKSMKIFFIRNVPNIIP